MVAVAAIMKAGVAIMRRGLARGKTGPVPCCCGLDCPFYYRADRCRDGPCNGPPSIYVCALALCQNGTPIGSGTVLAGFPRTGNCYRVSTAQRYCAPPPPPGCLALPVDALVYPMIGGGVVCANGCTDLACRDSDGWIPLTPCNCSSGCPPAAVRCDVYEAAIASGIPCPVWSVLGCCYFVDRNAVALPDLPPGWEGVTTAPTHHSCCSCCQHCVAPTMCVGNISFDGSGTAHYAGFPYECCCGVGSSSQLLSTQTIYLRAEVRDPCRGDCLLRVDLITGNAPGTVNFRSEQNTGPFGEAVPDAAFCDGWKLVSNDPEPVGASCLPINIEGGQLPVPCGVGTQPAQPGLRGNIHQECSVYSGTTFVTPGCGNGLSNHKTWTSYVNAIAGGCQPCGIAPATGQKTNRVPVRSGANPNQPGGSDAFL